MSEKPIHQILKGLSILTLVYYTATSINYLVESESKPKHLQIETATNSHLQTPHLEAHRLGN